MAISRLSGLRRLHSLQVCCSNVVKSRFLGSIASEATSPSVSSQTLPPVNPESAIAASGWTGKELTLAQRRKEYEAKMSSIRKKYMQEMQRKKSEQMRAEHVKKQVILKAKEERLALKKEKAQARAIEVQKETEALRARYDAQRAVKTAQREKRERKVMSRREKQIEKIRSESAGWIEKNDLELRILEAMADPVRLTAPLLGYPSAAIPVDNMS